VVVSHIPDKSFRARCGDAMTKRGKEVANAVTILESLLGEVKEPKTEQELQMFVKYWTAYAICKADHTARELEKSR
jgi:hypothetical protein